MRGNLALCFGRKNEGQFRGSIYWGKYELLDHLVLGGFRDPVRLGLSDLFDYLVHLVTERLDLLVPRR